MNKLNQPSPKLCNSKSDHPTPSPNGRGTLILTIRKRIIEGEGLIKSLIILFTLSCFLIPSSVSAKEYDGIWFLGFNLKQPPFDNIRVRQAVAHSLDKQFISLQIMGESVMPGSIVPYEMAGYDPTLKPYKYNPKFAKSLVKKAGYALSSPLLKTITLLHTDGDRTVEIAHQVQKDLKQIGMKVELIQVPYRDEEKWTSELTSNKYSMFLMGFKAEGNRVFTDEASVKSADTYQLLNPLFRTGGEANFTNYSSTSVDKLLDQISLFSAERENKLKEINKLLYKELPAVVLFYIERL